MAKPMASGIATANARTAQLRVAMNREIPSIRFQPAWKLGIAAYSLTSDDGRTER